MTAFAASLFTLAALLSGAIIAMAWLVHGRRALGLGKRAARAPKTMIVDWKLIERVTEPASPLVTRPHLVKARLRPLATRPHRLEWTSPANLAA